MENRKILFWYAKVEYLGHVMSNGMICPDKQKLQAIRDWPEPICMKYVQ